MIEQPRISFRDLRGILAIAVAMISFGGGAAISAIAQSDGGAQTPWDEGLTWQSVSAGNDANFGRYELFRATPGQRECFGINLPDQNPAGVSRAIAASCVDDSALQVGFLRGPAGTLAYGVASGETESVTLTGAAGGARQATLVDTPKGAKYFVVSTSDRSVRGSVRAADRNGRTVAERPTPE